jgi:DNA-binding ferritin-like protein
MGEHMTETNDDYNPQKSIEKLTANLEQPDKFAEIFCQAADKQKSIDKVLRDTVRTLIKCDEETRTMMKELLREVEKEDWKHFLKKVGTSGWAVFLLCLGALLQGIGRALLP